MRKLRLWRLRLKIHTEIFKSLWIAALTMLIVDAVDILVSAFNDLYIPIWSEGNSLARHPGTHAFWMGPALALHLEFYAMYALLGFVFYQCLRTVLKPRVSAILVSLPLWFEIYDTARDGSLGNISFLIFWFGWLRHLLIQ